MSKIIILEVPDKYNVSGRTICNIVRDIYPDVELRIHSNFDLWKKICIQYKLEQILPLFPNKRAIDNIDELIESVKNPKSIEERNLGK